MTGRRTTLALLILSAVSAIVLTAVAVTGSLMPGDRALAGALQATPWGRYLEPLADGIALWYIESSVLLIFVLLAVRRRAYGLAVAAALVFAAEALNPALKEATQRDRPNPSDLIIREPAPGYGFPSGHSMGAALFYGYALVVALQLTTGRVRLVLGATGMAAIGLIGWDRVYDGAHWPSDVAGGWAIGALLLFASVSIPGILSKLDGRRAHK